ncbi:MAG: hypothetical protein KJ579_09580, partial [Verrucomicrobia bacterium]|nr:hypothetical protein [Verrucomicrobiota bacterium]
MKTGRGVGCQVSGVADGGARSVVPEPCVPLRIGADGAAPSMRHATLGVGFLSCLLLLLGCRTAPV